MIAKGTVYYLDPLWGYRMVEAKEIEHGTKRIAQHRNAVVVRFTPKGKRKRDSVSEHSNPSVVILEGWGHPYLGGDVDVEENHSDIISYQVIKPRHGFDSPSWRQDFDSALGAYLSSGNARLLVDYRGYVVETIRTPDDLEVEAALGLVDEVFGPIPTATGQSLSVTLPQEISDEGLYQEGTAVRVWVNAYERSDKAREACLRHHGRSCCVCGFTFADQYGPIGDGFIEVHHLVPLSRIDGSYEVDPICDLRPVCSNCHSMLHRRDPPWTPDELRGMINNLSNRRGELGTAEPGACTRTAGFAIRR